MRRKTAKNFTEYVTVVLSKVHSQPGAWGLGGASTLPGRRHWTTRGEGHSPGHRLQLCFSWYVPRQWSAWWPGCLLGSSALWPEPSPRVRPFEIYQPGKTAPENVCTSRWAELDRIFLLIFICHKVFITTKCLKFQHLLKKFKSWSIDIILLIKVLKLKGLDKSVQLRNGSNFRAGNWHLFSATVYSSIKNAYLP